MTAPADTMPLCVRLAEADDDVDLRALYLDRRRSEFASLGLPDGAVAAICRQQYHARAQGYAQQYPHADHLVVELDERIVGALIVDGLHDGDPVTVVDIDIAADRRGRGLGTYLLGGVIDTADARGAAVDLTVAHGNPARRLYGRLGFEPVGSTELHARLRRPPARKDTR